MGLAPKAGKGLLWAAGRARRRPSRLRSSRRVWAEWTIYSPRKRPCAIGGCRKRMRRCAGKPVSRRTAMPRVWRRKMQSVRARNMGDVACVVTNARIAMVGISPRKGSCKIAYFDTRAREGNISTRGSLRRKRMRNRPDEGRLIEYRSGKALLWQCDNFICKRAAWLGGPSYRQPLWCGDGSFRSWQCSVDTACVVRFHFSGRTLQPCPMRGAFMLRL